MTAGENTYFDQAYKNVQHTPKPLAQFPSAEPPLLVHSVAEKHVPSVGCEAVDEAPVHCLKKWKIH